jgi:AAA15 family ATPase/GTPase
MLFLHFIFHKKAGKMVREIHIKNFKSIVEDKIELGRVNVFIGENGCGKSNILEAMAFSGASWHSGHTIIEKEALIEKGVRIVKPSLMINGFSGRKAKENIVINIKSDKSAFKVNLSPDNDDIHSSKWSGKKEMLFLSKYNENEFNNYIAVNDVKNVEKPVKALLTRETEELLKELEVAFTSEGNINSINATMKERNTLSSFIIYCLNTPTLRGLMTQSHKDPVGIYGEGLDVLIANFDKEEREKLASFNYMIDWLDAFLTDSQDIMKLKGYKLNRSKSTLYFSDKYMAKKNNVFSSENANEGILHVLFYLSVMVSKRTPKFFAIDNIENCLNPHLCRHLMTEICNLAVSEDKQVMITTHNPAILDGLNLFDDEIRLFEVKRNEKGHTETRRIKIKPNTDTTEQYKLSELWMRGYLGAIAQNF